MNIKTTYRISCPEFWEDGFAVYESTLREAKKARTETAKRIGCASWSVNIERFNSTTGKYEVII